MESSSDENQPLLCSDVVDDKPNLVHDDPERIDIPRTDDDDLVPSPIVAEPERVGVNFLFFRRLFGLMKILMRWKTPDNITPFYFGLIVMSAFTEVIINQIGLLTPQFYLVLNDRDFAGFKKLMIYAPILFLISTFVKSTTHLIGTLLALKTRTVLTRHLHQVYICRPAFYQWNTNFDNKFKQDIDNPDQRISQDIDQFARTFQKIVEPLVLTPFLIGYYTYAVIDLGSYLAVPIIYIYFFISTGLCELLTSTLAKVVFQRERAEGDFRFLHVTTRNNAEKITLLSGEETERNRLNYGFEALYCAQHAVIIREFFVRLLTTFISEFGSIICFVVIAIPIYSGKYDDTSSAELSKLISKTSFFCLYLIYKFTSITALAGDISELSSYTARIYQMIESSNTLNRIYENSSFFSAETPELCVDNELQLDACRLKAPNGLLLSIPQISIKRGELLIVQGPNGCGKTTWMRHLAALNPNVRKPHTKLRAPTTMFLTQSPYLLSDGYTFLDQVTYPFERLPAHISTELQELLELTNLTCVCSATSVNTPLTVSTLSQGQQQKLALLRVLIHGPEFVFLDEALSCVDGDAVIELIHALLDRDIGCIWVTHRSPDTLTLNFPSAKFLNFSSSQPVE